MLCDYLVMDHRVHTSVIFVSRTSRTADFEAFRNGDYQLDPGEIERSRHAGQGRPRFHLGASREPCRSAVERAFQLAQDAGKIISLDPNYSPLIWPDYREATEIFPRLLSYATITKPSLDDATASLGGTDARGIHRAAFTGWDPDRSLYHGRRRRIALGEGKLDAHSRPAHQSSRRHRCGRFILGRLSGSPAGRKPAERCACLPARSWNASSHSRSLAR